MEYQLHYTDGGRSGIFRSAADAIGFAVEASLTDDSMLTATVVYVLTGESIGQVDDILNDPIAMEGIEDGDWR